MFGYLSLCCLRRMIVFRAGLFVWAICVLRESQHVMCCIPGTIRLLARITLPYSTASGSGHVGISYARRQSQSRETPDVPLALSSTPVPTSPLPRVRVLERRTRSRCI